MLQSEELRSSKGNNKISPATLFLANAILSRRLQIGLTQEEVSERADMSPAQYGRIERGKNDMRIVTANRIALALETTLSNLLSGFDGEHVTNAPAAGVSEK